MQPLLGNKKFPALSMISRSRNVNARYGLVTRYRRESLVNVLIPRGADGFGCLSRAVWSAQCGLLGRPALPGSYLCVAKRWLGQVGSAGYAAGVPSFVAYGDRLMTDRSRLVAAVALIASRGGIWVRIPAINASPC